MKRYLRIFIRVIAVIALILILTYSGFKFYYQAESNRAIEKSLIVENLPIIGKKDASFTIVEFFDYRCPHCSTMSKLLDEAVNNDPSIKILLRPVVYGGEESFQIASLVLAADKQKQGISIVLHKEIMALPSVPVTYDEVKAIVESKGINVERAERDGQSFRPQMIKNTSLVADIGFYAVPALVIGDRGFLPQERMPGVNELRLMILDAKQRLGVK